MRFLFSTCSNNKPSILGMREYTTLLGGNGRFFLKEYNIHISLSLKAVTFGITLQMDKPEIQVKNFIIMLGKYFIFRNKCLKTLPMLIHFKSYLTKRLKIEQEIYFMRDKIAQFKEHGTNSLQLSINISYQ